MQDRNRNPNRVRYYITKSGEEPTVRSVRVAQNAPDPDVNADTTASRAADAAAAHADHMRPVAGVKRIVKHAIRRRTIDR